MKINVDYSKVQILKDKIDSGLYSIHSQEDLELLSKILAAAEGDIFPSKEEMEAHKIDMRAIETLDPKADYTRWDRAMNDVRRYENKYC